MSAYIRYPGSTGGGGGGGGTPAGPANSIQFNDGGSFNGSSTLLYIPISGHLYTSGLTDSSGNLSISPSGRAFINGVGNPVLLYGGTDLAPQTNIDFNGVFTGINVPIPSASGDIASKQYVDNSILALQPKAQVAVATTGPITLSGLQTIDTTYTTLAGDRVLVKNQGSGIANGIYIASAGPWTRATDFAVGLNVVGAYMAVANGTTNGNKSFIQSTSPAIVGTDALTFNVFNSNLYAASGQGIILQGGNVFALQIDGTTLTQSVSGVKVGDLAIADGQISNSAAIALSKLGLLVGYSSTTGTITTSDTVTSAISKLNGNIAALPTYTFSQSLVNTSGTVTLVNDAITPGNLYYYGTNSSGVKGWNVLPTFTFTQSVTNTSGAIALSGDVTSPGNSYYYGTDGSGTKGWYTIANPTAFTFSQSVTNTSGAIALSGDVTSPGNSYYYGTNSSGTKGFFTIANPNAYTFSTGLTNTSNTITANLSTGIAGSQSVIGGTAASETLTLSSTSNATKGKVLFGNSAYDEANNRLGIGNTSPTVALDVTGSVTLSNTLTIGTLTGLLKSTSGVVSTATAGTDYQTPLTFSTGLTNTSGTITANLSTGVAGGQSVIGGTAASNNLTLSSTANATKGSIVFGTSAYDEANNRLGIGTSSPTVALDVVGVSLTGSSTTGAVNVAQTWNTTGSVSLINGTITATAFGTASKYLNFTAGTANTYLGVLSSAVSANTSEHAFYATNGTNAVLIGVGSGGVAPAGTVYFRVNSSTGISFSSTTTSIPTGYLNMSGTAGSNQITGQQSSASTAITALKLGPNTPSSGALTMTTGNQIDVMIGGINNYAFQPTSGSATYTQLSLTPTINQTGGASGVTRSIYVNPTLTSAYDFRAFESLAGKVVMGGSLSSPAWGSSGVQLVVNSGTYTDRTTTASTTVATNMVNALAVPTLAATNTAVTYTDAATLYFAGPPTAGTNVTLSNAYTAYSNSGAWFYNGAYATPALAGSQSAGDRMVFQNITGANTGKFAFGQSAVNQFYIQAYGTTASPRFNIFTTNSTTAPMVSIQSSSMVVGTGASGALSGTSSTFEILSNGGTSALRVGFNNNTTSGFYISDTNASGTYVGNARTSAQLPTASGTANGLIQFNAAVMTFYSDTALTSGSSYTPTRRMSLDRGWWTLGAFASNNLTNYLGTFYTGLTVNATGSGATGYFLTTRNTNSMISSTGAYYNSTNMTATETSSAGYWQDAGSHRFFTNTGLTVGNTFSVTEQFRIDSTGYVGVGVSSPTALLSVAGSSTTRASMNIATGTAPTSPNSGDIWHDATQKTTYINNAGVNQSHSGTLFTQTADGTCANTTTETALTSTGVGTLTLPANFFVAGKTIKLQAYGFHSSTGGTTVTIRVKLGSTTILTATGSSGSDTNAGIIMDTVITCRTTGASGTVAGQGVYTEIGNSPNFRQMTNTAPVTVDTTTSQAITMTAQWGAAAAGRTITVTNLSVQVLN